MLVRTSSPLLEGWEECRSLDELRAVAGGPVCKEEPDLHWKGGRIPAELMRKVLGTIKEFPTREVGFVLYYNATSHEWDIECPVQVGYGGSVQFQGEKTPLPGYSEVGTIHTHPNMSAFWSATDYHDQRGKFGVHCVLGLKNGVVDKYLWTIFTPNGDYNKSWGDIAEPVDFLGKHEPDKEWLKTLNTKPAAPRKTRRSDMASRRLWDWSRGGEFFKEEQREYSFNHRLDMMRELYNDRSREAKDVERRRDVGRLAMVPRASMEARIENLYSSMLDSLIAAAEGDDVDVTEMMKAKLDIEDEPFGSMHVDPDDDDSMSDLAEACADGKWLVCKPTDMMAPELCGVVCELIDTLVDLRDGTGREVRMQLREHLIEVLPEIREAMERVDRVEAAADA